MPFLKLPFLVFVAATTLLYWLIPARWRSYFLSVCGCLFLAYIDPLSLLLLCGLTVITYILSRNQRTNPVILGALILLFCAIRIFLFYWMRQQIASPLVFIGFSFYLLKLIHYIIEMRHNAFRSHNFLDFFSYMLFFPTIAIGPIHLFDDFLRSERRVRWDPHMFANGLERILFGYAKVIVLAEYVISILFVSFSAKAAPHTATRVFLDSVSYGFHLYFSFAGYSDIAIGVSALFGYQICENFDRPFIKQNIGEFWQSWHMSLTSWCRKYIFMGIYSRWRNLGFALLTSMIGIGLWHELSARYLLWGIYHGTGLIAWRLYQRYIDPLIPGFEATAWKKSGMFISGALTFTFVIIGFTIPRSNSVTEIFKNFHYLFRGII